MQKNSVFRQAALDRLSSPEQLHALMQVTDARGWLALLGCALLLATAVVWGVFGRIPTKVEASGILIHSGGLADIAAVSVGQVTALEVDVGDFVQKGQVIAEVAQPELAEQLRGLRARLGELKANYQRVKQTGGQDVGLRLQASAQQRKSLQDAVNAAQSRTQELEARLTTQTKLYDKGLVTKETLEGTRQLLTSSQLSTQSMQVDMQRLMVDNFSAQRANEMALIGETMQVQETERQVSQLEERFTQNSHVISNHAGRVIEVRSMVGDVLAPGQPIVSLELTGERRRLEALLYVDSRQGKVLRPGMQVQIVPSVVRRERHGVLLGRVRVVESFPSTRRGMMRVLHNEQLVDAFLTETAGTPIAVRAELELDGRTPSGFRWSSGKGPDLNLTSGTRCVAYVTTRTQRPIGLVLPVLDFGG